MGKRCIRILFTFLTLLLIFIPIIIDPSEVASSIKEDNIVSNEEDKNSDSNTDDIHNSVEVNKDTTDLETNDINTDDTNSKVVEVSNVIGSIYIDGTSISNEILKGSDNEYYLRHTKDGKYDIMGSVFMDYRNNLEDRKLLIYGHNARSLKGAPFHDLELYVDKSFFNNHQYIDLTLNNESIKWQIFSVMIVPKTSNVHMKINFNDVEYLEHLNWMKNNSLYDTGVEVSIMNKIITLQTCYYDGGDSLLIINAKKV